MFGKEKALLAVPSIEQQLITEKVPQLEKLPNEQERNF
jgi:hypothetical protein